VAGNSIHVVQWQNAATKNVLILDEKNRLGNIIITISGKGVSIIKIGKRRILKEENSKDAN